MTTTCSVSPKQAAIELLSRRAARKDLLDFARYTLPTYEEAHHHRLIADRLEAVERGEIDRLAIFMPPRHGKSELASRRFPAWFLGRNPTAEILAASYNSELAMDFGRDVRGILRETEYQKLFPGVELRQDSQAADRLKTNQGGGYKAAGVGTAMTGRGADLLLIDDPVKDREEADSEMRRSRVWDWYRSTAYTRLSPGGRIVVIQCMIGSTLVLMASGTEKPLKDIRPGDRVATYDGRGISSSTVLNWKAQGSDRVYEIRTISGITVKANARHPFLVDRDGKLQWIRLRDLKVGDKLQRTAPIGESGAGSSAPRKDAATPLNAEASAPLTTARKGGLEAFGLHQLTPRPNAPATFATDTGSTLPNMTRCLSLKTVDAQFAENFPARMSGLIGAENSASIIATKADGFADSCATTAISPLDTGKQSASCSPPLNTFGIIPDRIEIIVSAGSADVFDIQVEVTENFIANGLISHNTRWHEDDLSGKILEQMTQGGDQWEVLSLPALSTEGEALWPERYPAERLHAIKNTLGAREWSALYMQRPQPDEGTFFQREWFKVWDKLPAELQYYGTSDYAVTDGGGDWTVHRVWGVDHVGHIYRVDGWRGQTTSDKWVDAKIDLIEKYTPWAWFGEAGVIQKAIEPMLVRRMRERRVRCRLEWLGSINDKPTRARGFQARAAMGGVSFERGADLAEFLSFPAGKHDDEVDVAGMIGRALDDAHPAILRTVIKQPNPPDLGSWGRRAEPANWKAM